MNEFLAQLLQHSEYFLRIAIAGLCGGVIGYERKNRMKEAGIRTHLIVAIGSALMMIVSKYGFFDIAEPLGKTDGSRVAAQIVSGVGFLGAGTIFMRKNVISGLTTAAGIWATAGIGMSIGAGLYGVGIATAVTIIIIQFIFHGHFRFLNTPSAEFVTVRLTDGDEALEYLKSKLAEEKIEILNIRMDKSASGAVNLDINVKFPANYDKSRLVGIGIANDAIKTLEY